MRLPPQPCFYKEVNISFIPLCLLPLQIVLNPRISGQLLGGVMGRERDEERMEALRDPVCVTRARLAQGHMRCNLRRSHRGACLLCVCMSDNSGFTPLPRQPDQHPFQQKAVSLEGRKRAEEESRPETRGFPSPTSGMWAKIGTLQ